MQCTSKKWNWQLKGGGGDVAAQDDPHPLGLGKRQRFLLKGQWKGISRELQTTGVTMFVQWGIIVINFIINAITNAIINFIINSILVITTRLFTSSPEVLSLFSKFQNLSTEEEMRASEAFQEHGEKVLKIILITITTILTMMAVPKSFDKQSHLKSSKQL